MLPSAKECFLGRRPEEVRAAFFAAVFKLVLEGTGKAERRRAAGRNRGIPRSSDRAWVGIVLGRHIGRTRSHRASGPCHPTWPSHSHHQRRTLTTGRTMLPLSRVFRFV